MCRQGARLDRRMFLKAAMGTGAALGEDGKELKVRYRINGKEGQAFFPENATIMLPIPP